MAKVLGLVASARKLGNTEILVRAALAGARERGHETAIARTDDFDIAPCRGCMTCVVKRRPCPLADEAGLLLDEIARCDALVLGAPINFLGPAAPVKLLTDRLLGLDYAREKRRPRPAAALLVGGLPRWEGYSREAAAVLLLTLGFRVAADLTAYGAGPGEVLLEAENERRARQVGASLMDEAPPALAGTDRCPVCLGRSFELAGRDRVRCPTCDIEARITPAASRDDENCVTLCFEPDALIRNRWEPSALERHMEEWVRDSGRRYLERLSRVKPLRAAYRNDEAPWVRPEREETPG